MEISLCKFHEIVKDREAWHDAVHKVRQDWTIEQQQKKLESLKLFSYKIVQFF